MKTQKAYLRLYQVAHILNEEDGEQAGSSRKQERAGLAHYLPKYGWLKTMLGPLSRDTSALPDIFTMWQPWDSC